MRRAGLGAPERGIGSAGPRDRRPASAHHPLCGAPNPCPDAGGAVEIVRGLNAQGQPPTPPWAGCAPPLRDRGQRAGGGCSRRGPPSGRPRSLSRPGHEPRHLRSLVALKLKPVLPRAQPPCTGSRKNLRCRQASATSRRHVTRSCPPSSQDEPQGRCAAAPRHRQARTPGGACIARLSEGDG
jgi:hypothetical protein